MKKQKTQSKLIVALTAVVILLVAISATLTFAYFTATNNATSTSMTFGELNLGDSAGLTLTNADTSAHTALTSGTIQYVVPGCSFTLAGNITVKGNINALVRAQLKVQVLQTHNANGVAYTASDIGVVQDVAKYKVIDGVLAESNDNDALIGILTEAYGATQNGKAATVYGKIETVMTSKSTNTAWVKVGDYTYYPKVVTATTAGTTILNFTGNDSKIVFEATDFGNDWQGAMVKVSFATQAIQAEHLVAPDGDDEGNDPDPIVITISEGSITNIAEIAGAVAWDTVDNNGVVPPPVPVTP